MSPRITIVLLCLGVLLGVASANPQYQQQRFQYPQYPQYPQQYQYPQVQARTSGGVPLPVIPTGGLAPGPAPGDFPPPGAAGGGDPCATNVLASNLPNRVAH